MDGWSFIRRDPLMNAESIKNVFSRVDEPIRQS
jgi:hypothetical protein